MYSRDDGNEFDVSCDNENQIVCRATTGGVVGAWVLSAPSMATVCSQSAFTFTVQRANAITMVFHHTALIATIVGAATIESQNKLEVTCETHSIGCMWQRRLHCTEAWKLLLRLAYLVTVKRRLLLRVSHDTFAAGIYESKSR